MTEPTKLTLPNIPGTQIPEFSSPCCVYHDMSGSTVAIVEVMNDKACCVGVYEGCDVVIETFDGVIYLKQGVNVLSIDQEKVMESFNETFDLFTLDGFDFLDWIRERSLSTDGIVEHTHAEFYIMIYIYL